MQERVPTIETQPQGSNRSFKIDATDLAIIESLKGDVRMPIAQIAGRLEMPESTIRHRLNRLMQEHVIEFSVVTNPHMLGFPIWVNLDIQVELSKIHSVAQSIAAAEEIYFVGLTTGNHDIIAGGIFRSNRELLDFTTNTLGSISGIVRVSTSLILDVVKRVTSFGFPPDAT
jgi:Lrp/AsnC family transcriptional regulator, regulator for asnA, asnC and gidA